MKKTILLLQGLERRLDDVDPSWQKTPFSERSETQAEIANLVAVIRCTIKEIDDITEYEMSDTIQKLRNRVERLEQGDDDSNELKRFYDPDRD